MKRGMKYYMKLYKSFLVFMIAVLLVACNLNENNDSVIEEKGNIVKELDESNEEIKKLEEDYSNLEIKLNEANKKIKELESELENNESTEEVVNELTEDEARKIAFQYIEKNHNDDNIAHGYQYCIHKDKDVFVVEKFPPEPGTSDRSAMLLQQFELDIETGQVRETEQNPPGQKKNCMNGTDI